MNPASEDIKDMITQSGGAGTFGTDVFISHEPPTPNKVVTIFDTGGFGPDLATDIYNPTVMVRIRGAGNGYQAAYAKAELIRDLLHGVHNETWNSTRYILIQALSDIMYIERDEKTRPILSVNFRIIRTPA
jgi:hypothetical protein